MKVNRNIIKRALLGIHKIGTRFRIHILPVHYYSPVPNILELQKTRNIWAKKSEMPGVLSNLAEQTANLKKICMVYQNEYEGNKSFKEAAANHFGPGYGYIEAQALHGFIRYYKPKRIVEVGSGVSTYCMLKASEKNSKETGKSCKIVSIEPYPSSKLLEMQGIDLVVQQVQTVPFEVFTELQENDLLFIDSSHTVKAGSDVNYLILEVLPRLRKGVIVHFHDIFFPYDFQRDLFQTFLFWAETSLLHAFLVYNEKIEIIVCLSQLHYERRDILKEVFPEYNPQSDFNGLSSDKYKPFHPIVEHFPSSIYLRVN